MKVSTKHALSFALILFVLPLTSAAAIWDVICKNGGWQLYDFATQGQCVSLVKSGNVKVWGLFRDFLFYPNQQNPSPDQYGNADVWHYRYSVSLNHNPAGYVHYTDYIIEWDGARESWTANPASEYNTPLLGARPYQGVGVLHPDDTSLSLASWRSPVNGVIAVSGYFDDIHADCGEGVDWAVERETLGGPLVIAQGTVKGPPGELNDRFEFNFILPVAVDDYLDFIIDPGLDGNSACDTTWADITIVGPIPTN